MAIVQPVDTVSARQARVGRLVGAAGALLPALYLVGMIIDHPKPETVVIWLAGAAALGVMLWFVGGWAGRFLGKSGFVHSLWVGPVAAVACMAGTFAGAFSIAGVVALARGEFDLVHGFTFFLLFVLYGLFICVPLGVPLGVVIWWLARAPSQVGEQSGPPSFDR